MAVDIAPALYEKIKKEFDKKFENAKLFNAPIKDTYAKLKSGEATFRDADLFAAEVGSMLSDSMKGVLKLESMPNQRLYYNIAEKTVGKSLQDSYGLVSSISQEIQEEMNKAAGIKLKPASVPVNNYRINEVVNKAARAQTQEELDKVLDTPVKTYVRSVADDTKKKNASLHNKAGLNVRVEREYDGVGLHNGTDVCDWCVQRAGSWSFDKALKVGAFERHEGCGCIIDYITKKGRERSTGKYSGFERVKEKEARITHAKKLERKIRQKRDNITINARNNANGRPNAIYTAGAKLNSRQNKILGRLPEFDSKYIFKKNDVSMKDLAALTADTGVEYAMFTRGAERLVVRGNEMMVNIGLDKAKKLAENGYKWSGHTHVGADAGSMLASDGDYAILQAFNQKTSVVYNSIGQKMTYSL